jgi:hypothetical protein
MAKAYATMILMDINPNKYLPKFISTLQNYTPKDLGLTSKTAEWPQTIPNMVESGYWVYKKTGDSGILPELQRMLNIVGVYDTVVQPITAMPLPLNKRKAFVEMMYQMIELFPEDNYAIQLFNEVTEPEFLYSSNEVFNAYYYPKYEIYGQSFNVPDDKHRSMDNLLTTSYILNMASIVDYGYPLDMASWARSYVAVQNSLWTRTGGANKDDLMFGWEHNPQDRLGQASTYTNYIRIFLDLPHLFQNGGSPLVAGTATARLSLEYLKSIQVNGIIPYADDYWLYFQSFTYEDALLLMGVSIPAGWYGDVGVFEIALMNYADVTTDNTTATTP